MKMLKKIKDLCPPSLFYFTISMVFFFMTLFQNFANTHSYNLGNFSCRVPNTTVFFIIKLLYILFWTWILDLICKDGYTVISWLLVLFPFILLFVILGLVMLNM